MSQVYDGSYDGIRGFPASALVPSSYRKRNRETSEHDQSYYSKCLVGGILSSSIRWVLTPFDAIKCNMQVNPVKFPTFSSGLSMVFREQGLSGLYRGFLPTVLSYSSQTGTKYMLYEVFKDNLTAILEPEDALAYKSVIYVASAGCAEAIADVFMCPWEMLKVQVQTSNQFPRRFGPALVAMMQQRHILGGFPFGSLGPLWSRQILGTVANFYTFEHTVDAIYTHVLTQDKESYSRSMRLGVTLVSGYIAGMVSTLISHPADSIISLKARHPDKTVSQIVREVGWKRLATQGLGPRVVLTGSIIGIQWFVYDTFKTVMGMGTTGGKS
jgi:solute carrier family 25 phosphate transporter 3